MITNLLSKCYVFTFYLANLLLTSVNHLLTLSMFCIYLNINVSQPNLLYPVKPKNN